MLWPRQQSHSMLPYTTHGLDTHTHGHGCPIRFFPDSSQASLGVFAAMRHTTLYSYVCMYVCIKMEGKFTAQQLLYELIFYIPIIFIIYGLYILICIYLLT